MQFSVEQVRALCGGKLPGEGEHTRDSFDWQAVEHFQLEDRVLQPYAGHTMLPGPGIKIDTSEVWW